MTSFFTGCGDDGKTAYLGDGRLEKYDLRIEALGVIDEASAAAGLARAAASSPMTRDILLKVQRELYAAMAEVAAKPEQAARFRTIQQEHVESLERVIQALEIQVDMPSGFIVPGDSLAGGALALARTVARRAERRLAELVSQDQLVDTVLLAYFNRLSSLLFVMEIFEIQASGRPAPTMAKES